jgi:Putative beta barrel porin-7 (BBP7)
VLGRWLESGNSLSVRFFSIDNWTSRTPLATPFIVELPTFPPLFAFGLTGITATYATRLYSTELNWQRPASGWFSWLVGFRWVELYEDLNLDTRFLGNSADIGFRTANRLYGGQAGAAATLYSRGAARIDSVLKAGLFGNAASQQFRVSQTIGPLFSAADRSGQVAFLGEIGVVGVYQWTDSIALRGGYQLLWLDGVALAPDQIAATQIITRNGIDTTGDSFYHGALVGIEVAW